MTTLLERTWVDVCGYDDLQAERGIRVLVRGDHVAVFRTYEGEVHAIESIDPFSGASVLARGIVGTHGDSPFVASPMYKQRFDLRTGRCLEDPSVRVRVFPVEVTQGRVLVGGP
jgi:nitrite reductase (NADH) small subunit